MIPIYKDHVVPKYKDGIWSWNDHNQRISFSPWNNEVLQHESEVSTSGGFKFKASIDQVEEVIFWQEFMRPDTTFDADVVIIQDIKNLVLFLAPPEILTNKLISFVHTKPVNWFLNALITYFQYFLKLVEYILIRRDEVSGKTAQVESKETFETKRIYSEYLAQYRLILAREYSAILLGNGEMQPYYHTIPVVNIAKTSKDMELHESFLALCTQIVWITHHRRAYNVIEDEINRLFRSHHFIPTRKPFLEFSIREQQVLFGENNKRVNFRYQNSPLIQELQYVRRRNLQILWIGERKYRGTDLRLQQLELEIIIPDSQLALVDVSHGILGHPKAIYNTLLELDWKKVRERYSESYDPYRLIRQPYLEVPKLDALKQKHEHLESYFSLKDDRYECNPETIKKWKIRDKIVDNMRNGTLLLDVVSKCRHEIENTGRYKRTSLTKAEFMAKVDKFRKKK